ncbi:ribonucleotide-diphosphate reductase subunit beta [Citrobacter koseri]|uniref:Ribonucleotide-diphosphate reductase subunit beta n=1 Tax=Citrobacter koseri TaxID=545 RepID=A0A2X2VZ36_CITKO|nr:ribonucleotide-diphosphate reductase subunit beta [Citrobacter koseri]
MAYTTFSQTKTTNSKSRCSLASRSTWHATTSKKYDIFEKLIEKQLSFFWRRKKLTFHAIVSISSHCRNTKNIFSSAT